MGSLPHNGLRQYMDAVSSFTALEEAQHEASQVRGGMYWHKGQPSSPQAQYLVRTSVNGAEKSLGSRSAQNEAIFNAFHQRKMQANERLASLQETVGEHQRLNKALRVGRVDPIVVKLINQFTKTQLIPFLNQNEN
jgi:hypothetical protein